MPKYIGFDPKLQSGPREFKGIVGTKGSATKSADTGASRSSIFTINTYNEDLLTTGWHDDPPYFVTGANSSLGSFAEQTAQTCATIVVVDPEGRGVNFSNTSALPAGMTLNTSTGV